MSRFAELAILLACVCMALALLPAASSRILLEDKPVVPGLNLAGDLQEFDTNVNIAPDELFVQFSIGASAKDIHKVLKEVGAEIINIMKPEDAESGELVLARVAGLSEYKNAGGIGKAAGRAALKKVADSIESNALVAMAYPNWVMSTPMVPQGALSLVNGAAAVDEAAVAATAADLCTAGSKCPPNDVYYVSGKQWNMGNGVGGANAIGAWSGGHTRCDRVVIGSVDGGIQINHKDLAANIWTNPRELVVDKLDNDASGKADDKWGWNFVSNRRTVYSPGKPNFPLGTHAGGVIGAVGNNAIGVAGVCWTGVKMLSAQVFDRDGNGMLSQLLEAVQYLGRLRQTGVNIIAFNYLGVAEFPKGPTLEGAMKSIEKILADASKDMLLVAPAGNNGGKPAQGTVIIPQSLNLDNMIVVGSLGKDGQPSVWSNYGPEVDIFAPGETIFSTMPDNKYDVMSGTSSAVPHVTGAAGLYAAAYNKKYGRWPTALDIKAAILATSKDNPALAGKCSSGKQLDIGALLASLELA